MLDLPGHSQARAAAAAAVCMSTLCAHGLHLALVPAICWQPVRIIFFGRLGRPWHAQVGLLFIGCSGCCCPFFTGLRCQAKGRHLQ